MESAATKTQLAPLDARIAGIVQGLLAEQGRGHVNVTPVSSFERDLGLSSLDLVELVVRIETRLDVQVPEEIADLTDTAASWAAAIEQEAHEGAAKSAYRIVPPHGEAPAAPTFAHNLLDVLRWQADAAPGRVHVHFLENGTGRGITCGQMLDSATVVARGLVAAGLKRNQTVGILLPNSADFFDAFFGVALAGGIPVPIYPPANANRLAEYVERQVHILRNAGVRFLITFDRVKPISRLLRIKVPDLREVALVSDLRDLGKGAPGRLPEPSSIAVIQYTSGTTARPKGAVLTHAGLLANIRAIGKALQVGSGDAVVSWLPLASDLGLVGCWLFSLYHATPLTLLSPLEFLERPESWLWAIHDSRGTLSAAPNFAYETCARRIPMWTLEGLDLSCWRAAVNAGEAVLPSTVAAFTRRFERAGFRPENMLPCYGLSENSVALAIPEPGHRPIERDGAFSVGAPLSGTEVRIVDQANRDLPDGAAGRLLFRGESLCSGYYRDPQTTAAAQHDSWMETGDLAFRFEGQLYITGRSSDVIVSEGRAIAPEPLEEAVAALPGVVANSVAAFGVADPEAGTERVVVAAETTAAGAREKARVKAAVHQAVEASIGRPGEVLLIPPGALPKTSNGKIRRADARALYTAGRLAEAPGRPFAQMAGLWWWNLGAIVRRGITRSWHAAGRATRMAAARSAAALGWVCATTIGGKRSVPPIARVVLALLGRQATHRGAPLEGPAVFITSRAARLDALALVSEFRRPVALAGEEALLGLPPWAAALLRPLVIPTAGQMTAALRAGTALIAFPDSPAGMSSARCRYRLEALEAAAKTGTPVIPLALRQFRARLVARSAAPIQPGPGADPRELRERARDAIRSVYA